MPFESDFARWLSSLGRRTADGPDRWRVESALGRDALVALPGFPASDGDFPAECPVSAGEGARVATADGFEVAVFAEGWSATCRGDAELDEVYALGGEALDRWWEELGGRARWDLHEETDYDDATGLTRLVVSRRARPRDALGRFLRGR